MSTVAIENQQNKKVMLFKAFVLGSCYPVMLFPFTIFGQMHRLHPTDLSNPNDILRPLIIENVPLVVPFYFGLWNMIFIWYNNLFTAHQTSRNTRYIIGGMILGFAFTMYGLVVHAIPTELFNIPEDRQFMGPIFASILFGLVYRYLQQNLNVMFGIEPPASENTVSKSGVSMLSWVSRLVAIAVAFVGIPLVGMIIWVAFFPWQYTG